MDIYKEQGEFLNFPATTEDEKTRRVLPPHLTTRSVRASSSIVNAADDYDRESHYNIESFRGANVS